MDAYVCLLSERGFVMQIYFCSGFSDWLSAYFDELGFGKSHSRNKTDLIIEGRLQRTLQNSLKAIPGCIRHWEKRRFGLKEIFQSKSVVGSNECS